ncbi:MAG TPA: mechanosensitive ion channel [Saprospiraceae bacterium]|nr:mechanosensitive ion channel [Saprospiraceae bacterium]
MVENVLNKELLSLGAWEITFGQAIAILLIIILAGVISMVFSNKYSNNFFERNGISVKSKQKLKRYLIYLLASIFFYVIIQIFDLEYDLFHTRGIVFNMSLIAKALIILQIARIADWIISNLFIQRFYSKRDSVPESHARTFNTEDKASKVVQLIVYILAIMTIISNLNIDFSLFKLKLGGEETVNVHINNVLTAILVLLIARLIVWLLTNVVMYALYKQNDVDEGSKYAINQILKYVIYVFAILIALRSLGIDMTIIMGGAAALLVGIGLGLQQTFNDFFSGLVLLFERTVSIGDILYIDGKAATVKKIGLRSSIIEPADSQSIIVPNSKLVNNSVQNWTHFDPNVRFSVQVGVAYGSDTVLVRDLLLKAAHNCKRINRYPKPFIRFQDFGDSSLHFELFFYSNEYLANEDVKSDLRFEIDRLFRENKITIPFPQRDVWIREQKNMS